MQRLIRKRIYWYNRIKEGNQSRHALRLISQPSTKVNRYKSGHIIPVQLECEHDDIKLTQDSVGQTE